MMQCICSSIIIDRMYLLLVLRFPGIAFGKLDSYRGLPVSLQVSKVTTCDDSVHYRCTLGELSVNPR